MSQRHEVQHHTPQVNNIEYGSCIILPQLNAPRKGRPPYMRKNGTLMHVMPKKGTKVMHHEHSEASTPLESSHLDIMTQSSLGIEATDEVHITHHVPMVSLQCLHDESCHDSCPNVVRNSGLWAFMEMDGDIYLDFGRVFNVMWAQEDSDLPYDIFVFRLIDHFKVDLNNEEIVKLSPIENGGDKEGDAPNLRQDGEGETVHMVPVQAEGVLKHFMQMLLQRLDGLQNSIENFHGE
ncbi:hypothetical protein VNO77_21708 [Canavalia gladiata]|uniref:Uncharacterized protein n=1 Tax=Canavalia gladiata TaxID=3824 RepID=A0AAN9L4Q5_CANGL